MSLKQKTINGVLWNSIGKVSIIFFEFIIGVVLANILSPKEFGLIAILSVVVGISSNIVSLGFVHALAQKRTCTDEDYSTVFVVNVLIAFMLIALIYSLSSYISIFYKEPQLKLLVQVISINLFILGITIVQRIILQKDLDFRTLNIIASSATLFSGILSIVAAMSGLGVWALIIKTISRSGLESALMWYKSNWTPKFRFYRKSFIGLFSYGSKMFVSRVFSQFFGGLNELFIGHIFNTTILGNYSRANSFKALAGDNLSEMFMAVGFSSLVTINDDIDGTRNGHRVLFRSVAFIIFLSMSGLFAVSENLILGLIGYKWIQTVSFLQILSVSGVFLVLKRNNLNYLSVVGNAKLFLKIEIIDQLFIIPSLIVGFYIGIIPMLWAIVLNSILSYVLFTYLIAPETKYSLQEQLSDIKEGAFIAIIMGGIVYGLGYFLKLNYIFELILQIILGVATLLLLGNIFKNKDFLYIKSIISTLALKVNRNG